MVRSSTRLDLVGRDAREGIGDDRFERAVEEHLHQAVGRVVAAGVLRALPLLSVPPGEAEAARALGDLRHQLEQALVDRAQLLGAHVAPVDAGEGALGPVSSQASRNTASSSARFSSFAGIERGALAAANRCRPAPAGPRRGSPAADPAEHHLGRLPQVEKRSWALRRSALAQRRAYSLLRRARRAAAATSEGSSGWSRSRSSTVSRKMSR
jgi:hypothetical protein